MQAFFFLLAPSPQAGALREAGSGFFKSSSSSRASESIRSYTEHKHDGQEKHQCVIYVLHYSRFEKLQKNQQFPTNYIVLKYIYFSLKEDFSLPNKRSRVRGSALQSVYKLTTSSSFMSLADSVHIFTVLGSRAGFSAEITHFNQH